MPRDYTSHDRAVRITIAANANPPLMGGRTWTVEAGYWRAQGATEKAASDAFAAGIREFLAHYRTPMVLTFRGCVAVVTPDLAGSSLVWRQQIAIPDMDDVAQTREDAASWEEAAARARFALARYTTDWHDDASVQEAAAYVEGAERFGYDEYGPDALYRAAAWVRAATAAMDTGRSDWYRWASDHEAGFAVPRPAAPQQATPRPTLDRTRETPVTTAGQIAQPTTHQGDGRPAPSGATAAPRGPSHPAVAAFTRPNPAAGPATEPNATPPAGAVPPGQPRSR